MSFQAYLDKVEEKTGLTPRQIIERAHARGIGQGSASGEIVAWLTSDTPWLEGIPTRPSRDG